MTNLSFYDMYSCHINNVSVIFNMMSNDIIGEHYHNNCVSKKIPAQEIPLKSELLLLVKGIVIHTTQ